MNPLIEAIYQSGEVADAAGQPRSIFPTSLPYDQGCALYAMIRRAACRRSLEIGMAYGLSTLFMCQAHADHGTGAHTSIDPLQHGLWETIGLLNLERAGLRQWLSFRADYAHNALPALLAEQQRFDFVFIDGSHRFDHTMIELYYSDLLLDVGGLLVFDDTGLPAVRKALSFVLRNLNYRPALEFAEAAPEPWRVPLRIARYLRQAPADGWAALLSVHTRRYAVLRKIAEYDKSWEFYRGF